MEEKDVKKHKGKKRRIILKSGRVYTCQINNVSKPDSKNNALVDVTDEKNHCVSFSTNAIEAIENLGGKK